jgi:tetratricopeptide (TPR) repeat protein
MGMEGKGAPAKERRGGQASAAPVLIGRARELSVLKARLDALDGCKGSLTVICGEPGIGKTRLVQAFRAMALARGATVIEAAADPGSQRPFSLFSHVLPEGLLDGMEREGSGFSAAFAIAEDGHLLAKAEREGRGSMDGVSLAGVLSAVQSFARDSLGAGTGKLGRLDYGKTKILIEQAGGLVLAAVLDGEEHPDMRAALKSAVPAQPVALEAALKSLAAMRFRVRRELADVNIEKERTTIADLVHESLTGSAARAPTVVLLEDLHWADAASLFVLGYVARSVQASRLMVVGTMRPSEDRAKSEETFAIPGASEGRIDLSSFDIESVRGLSDEVLGPNDVPEDFLATVHRQSGGNPFFVVELLRQMTHDGAIVDKGGIKGLTDEGYAMPASVEEVARRRFDSLEPDAMAFAEYVACIGYEFELETARSYGEAEDVARGLESLRSLGVVNLAGARGSFAHAILHKVAYSGISERWKRAHHLKIGAFIEATCANDPYARLYELADHFHAGGDHAKALGLCSSAATKAEDEFAFEMARDYYTKALISMEAVGGVGLEGQRAELLERKSYVCAILGDYDAAIKSLDSISFDSIDDHAKVRVLTRYGYVHNRKSAIDDSIASLDRALAILGDDHGDEYGRICVTQGNNWWYKGDVEKARSYIGHAKTIFEGREGRERDLAEALRVWALVQAGTGDHEGAISTYRWTLDISRKFNDKRRVAAMLGNLGNVHASRGELAKSLEYYEQGLVLLKKLRHKHNIAVMSLNMGATYYAMGKLSLAKQHFVDSAEAMERIGDPYGLATAYMNTGVMEYMVGDWEGALGKLEKAEAIARKNEIRQLLSTVLEASGAAHLEKGDYARSERALLESQSLAKDNGQLDIYVSGYSNLAELNRRRGDAAKARELAAEGVRIAEEKSVQREGAFAMRALGAAMGECGDFKEGSEMLAKARERLGLMGEKVEASIADYYWGQLLARSGDSAGAKERLGIALATFRECGMESWASKVEKLLHS